MAPKRIRVVDDDAGIRAFLTGALRDEGYVAAEAADGRAALAALDGFPADLVLLDVRMPAMDGTAFLAVQRERPGPRARVVALAASPNGLAAAHAGGADAALAKPLALDDLLALVALQLQLALHQNYGPNAAAASAPMRAASCTLVHSRCNSRLLQGRAPAVVRRRPRRLELGQLLAVASIPSTASPDRVGIPARSIRSARARLAVRTLLGH